MHKSLVALAVSASVHTALGALYSSPADLPSHKVYDYIVVGSGPGGATVGARLSEDRTKNVLVIEAGINADSDINVQIPWEAPFNTGKSEDWNFTTTAQAGLNGRSIDYPRGKALGGSSDLNFMVWDRGAVADHDRMATVVGDDRYKWENIQSYALKVEHMVPPADGHNTTGEWDPSIHGTSGPVHITLPGYSLPSDARVINSTREFGDEFPFNLDMSSGNPLGIGWSPANLRNSTRDSSWTAYLRPNIGRPNLDVLMKTQVTRVLRTGTSKGLPVFRGVEFAQYEGARVYTLKATREIIVAAGAVMTPHLLMHSGIGNAHALSALNIPVIVNNTYLGTNLQDHAFLPSHWEVNDQFFTMDIVQQNATYKAQVVEQWQNTRTGPLVLNPTPQIGWLRVNTSAPPFNTMTDPSAGGNSPHFELIFSPAFGSYTEPAPATGKHFTVITATIAPAARGTLTIASNNPWAPPLINPGLLNAQYDIDVMVYALRAAIKFMGSHAFSDFVGATTGDFSLAIANGTDAAFAQYARNHSTTVWHPSCTAKMAPYNSTAGVVSPDFKVKGTVGLRIVDASVFPYVPGSHPMYPLYILAEIASDIIKSENV